MIREAVNRCSISSLSEIAGASEPTNIWADVAYWHFCDITRSRADFRFRGKNGHAADITAMTEFEPQAVMSRVEIPQRSSLLP
jgi:hypothetical protein